MSRPRRIRRPSAATRRSSSPAALSCGRPARGAAHTGSEGLLPADRGIRRCLLELCWREGRTNREIADVLVLSIHTIERHLANAYRKIGARNRTDATAFVLANL